MQEVMEHAIKPTTKGLGLIYFLLVNQDQPLQAKVMTPLVTTLTLQQSIVLFEIQIGHDSLTISIFYCFFYFLSPTYSLLRKKPLTNLLLVLKTLAKRAHSGYDVPFQFIRITMAMIFGRALL